MQINQKGDPIKESPVFTSWHRTDNPEEIAISINLLMDHLGLEVWKTNATKHGEYGLELRKVDE